MIKFEYVFFNTKTGQIARKPSGELYSYTTYIEASNAKHLLPLIDSNPHIEVMLLDDIKQKTY